MLGEWKEYVRDGVPTFTQSGDSENLPVVLTITNATLDDAGSFGAWWVGEVVPGDEYRIDGTWEIGAVKAVWHKNDQYVSSDQLPQPNDIVTVPDGVDGLRIDCRWWYQVGAAQFTNIMLELVDGVGVPLPEPIEPPTLTQLTGVQWGGHYYMVEHPLEEGEPLPTSPPIPEGDEVFTIQGYKIGRNIALEIVHPVQDAPEEQEI